MSPCVVIWKTSTLGYLHHYKAHFHGDSDTDSPLGCNVGQQPVENTVMARTAHILFSINFKQEKIKGHQVPQRKNSTSKCMHKWYISVYCCRNRIKQRHKASTQRLFSIPYLAFLPDHIGLLSDSVFLSQTFQGIQLLHLDVRKKQLCIPLLLPRDYKWATLQNDKCTHLLPHGAVCPHEIICTTAVQIFGLLFAVFLTVFFINTLDRSEVERLHTLWNSKLNNPASVMYVQCSNYLCGHTGPVLSSWGTTLSLRPGTR